MVKGKLLGISLAFLTIVLAALFAFLLLRGNYTLNEKVVANKNDEIVTVLVDDYVRKNKDSFFRASNCKVTILDGDKDVTETFFEDFKTEDNVLNKRYENKVYTFKIKGLFLDKEVKFKFSYEDYRIINRDGTPVDYFMLGCK